MIKNIFIIFLILWVNVAQASSSRIVIADQLQSSDLANTYTINYLALNNIGSGTTLQYLRGDGTLATLNTSVVPELTNLYYTNARARAAFSATGPLSYNSGTGDFSLPFPMLIPNGGTNLAPTIAFNESGADTGIYSTGDGNLSIANNGVNTATFEPGLITFNVPLAGTGFPFTSNANTIAAYDSLGAAVSLPNWTTADVTGDVSHAYSATPVDNTNYAGISQSISVDPVANVTNASRRGVQTNLIFDNGNAGFNDTGGSFYATTSRFEHNGSGTISADAEVFSGSANFSNAGHLGTFKGVDMNTGVGSGYTIDNYNGLFSSLNSTGGIFGGITMAGGGAGLSGITSANINASNFNMNIDGASVLTQGLQLNSNSLNFGGTSTAANNLQGNSIGINVKDNAAANGGIIGNNTNIQVTDAATSQNINVNESDLAINGTAVVSGVALHQYSLQTHNSAAVGGSNGLSVGLSMDGTSSINGYSAINANVNTTSGTPTIGNNLNLISYGTNINDTTISGSIFGVTGPMQIGGTTAVSGSVEGIFSNTQLLGSATANNIIGNEINILTDGTAAVSNQIAGLKVNIQTNGVPHNGNDLRGIEINMNGANLSPAQLASGAQKQGLSVEDGTLNAQYNYTIPGSAFFTQIHNLGGQAIVASGDPVTNALAFGVNLGPAFVFNDDWGPDFTGLNLGYVAVGSVSNVQGASGKTANAMTLNLSAASTSSGAGTITNGYGYFSGGILPSGGTLAVTNFHGFHIGAAVCAIVGNCWGIYDDSGSAENYLGKLAIGSSTKKVTNTDTALEIGNSKAFLNGRGSTATKNALAHVAGMQFYDTDLNFLQYYDGSGWVTAGGGGGGGTVTSVDIADTSAVPIYSISNNPITTSGTINLTLYSQNANKVLAGPTTGADAEPNFRALVAADIPSLPYASSTLTSAHLFVGNGSSVATDVAASGDLTLANTGAFSLVNASVTGQPITGYVSGAGTVSATDTILQAIQKLNGNAAAISGSAVTSLTGDVTGTGPGATATTIANLAVTNAKIANSTIDLTTKVTNVLPTSNGGVGTSKQEAPTGTINNSNTSFSLTSTPVSNASVELFQSGLILIQGTDYTISGTTITMTAAPNFGQTLYAVYRF